MACRGSGVRVPSGPPNPFGTIESALWPLRAVLPEGLLITIWAGFTDVRRVNWALLLLAVFQESQFGIAFSEIVSFFTGLPYADICEKSFSFGIFTLAVAGFSRPHVDLRFELCASR